MKKKNWIGNKNSPFSTIGASNHSSHEREKNDYYATDPATIDSLLEVEKFNGTIWECASGEGHLSKRLQKRGLSVISTDIIDRGYCDDIIDFLKIDKRLGDNIITNPPYRYAQDFVEKSLELIEDGYKVAMFLKLTFLEGQRRRSMFEKYPPKNIYVFSKRQICVMNGNFENIKTSAMAYAWYIWEKGFDGKPQLDWI